MKESIKKTKRNYENEINELKQELEDSANK